MAQREIKFRAWNEKEKKWLENVIVHSNGQFSNMGGMWMNSQAVLMQFTGLKDKNGKEIYEGDVVRINLEHDIEVGEEPNLEIKKEKIDFITSVIYEKNQFTFSPKIPMNHSYSSSWALHEIIGNIYENPELLK